MKLKLRLSRFVDGEWWEYGKYSLDDKYDLIAFSEACKSMKDFDLKVEVVKEEQK